MYWIIAVVGGAENEPGMDKADFVLVFFREHEADKKKPFGQRQNQVQKGACKTENSHSRIFEL